MGFKHLGEYLKRTAEEVAAHYSSKLGGYRIAKEIKGIYRVAGTIHAAALHLAGYWKYIEKGRRAGAKQPPPKVMRAWVAYKGLSLQVKSKVQKRENEIRTLAFLIGRKIARDGIKPKPFLKEIMSAKSSRFEKGIGDALKLDIGKANRQIMTEIYGKSN